MMNSICNNPLLVALWVGVASLLILLGIQLNQGSSRRGGRAGGERVSLAFSSFVYDGPATLLLVVIGGGLFLGIWMLLRACSASPVQGVTQFVNQTTIVQLQQNLENGIRTESYVEHHIPVRELVQGDSGGYYLIDLRDPITGDSIFFDLGKYRKDVFAASFTRAWERVEEDIIKPMKRAGVQYQVFVVGSADTIGAHAEHLGDLMGNAPKRVAVFRRSLENQDLFVSEPHEEVIPVEYSNRHLPNLRASFIQDRLRDAKVPSTILDGSVHASYKGEDRNAVILLYWPVDHSTGPGTGSPK
jgi:hypothetical protein